MLSRSPAVVLQTGGSAQGAGRLQGFLPRIGDTGTNWTLAIRGARVNGAHPRRCKIRPHIGTARAAALANKTPLQIDSLTLSDHVPTSAADSLRRWPQR